MRSEPKTQTAGPSSLFRSPKQRQKERVLKRQAVLQAAVRMFNERGFHATSLDDVAASLGVTKPVIYHYLGNKDQVLFECVRLGLQQIREAAAAARQREGSGFDRLKAFLRAYAETNMDDFGRCVIRTGDETLSPESRREFRALKGEIDRDLREVIAEGVADGSVHADDIRLTAFTLAGALNWPARWFDPNGPDKRADVAAAMVDILCEGLRRRDRMPPGIV